MIWTEERKVPKKQAIAATFEKEEDDRKYMEQLNKTPLHCFIMGNAQISLKPATEKLTPTEEAHLKPATQPCAVC